MYYRHLGEGTNQDQIPQLDQQKWFIVHQNHKRYNENMQQKY